LKLVSRCSHAAGGNVARGNATGVMRGFAAVALFLLGVGAADAVVVRGRVTDALGRPVLGARVQLIEAGKVESIAYAGVDGSFEIRDADTGRFTLLSSAAGFFPAIGQDFYGGGTDVVHQDVVLALNTLQPDISLYASGVATPMPQLTGPASVIEGNAFATRVGVADEMRQTPGAFVVQTGQGVAPTALYMRGGPADGSKVLVDGVAATDLGGGFDFGTVGATGVGSLEIYRGPNSALLGMDSQTSVVGISMARGSSLAPVFNYSGDAGNFHTWRNEVTLSGAHSRFDYFAGFSRFDTSNALAEDRDHLSTLVANVGVALPRSTELRFTIRDGVAAQGLPGAHDFYGVSQDGKQGDQDLYSGVTLENRTKDNWHNLLRYDIARKREQADYFGNQGTLVTIQGANGPYQAYAGDVVTIRGANGYVATGQAQLLSVDREQDSNRDELYYQTDYVFPKNVTALFGFRYENERGSYESPGPVVEHETTQRTNFDYNALFQGDIKSRVFYSLGGLVEKNHLFGIAGTPRLGLAYVPVRPGGKYFHGTRFRLNLATGVQEPSLAAEFLSLYKELELAGDTADVALYQVKPFDVGVDQNIHGERMVFKAGYFHEQFSHQLEEVTAGDLTTYFGFTATTPGVSLADAEVNSLAYRAQGVEAELKWLLGSHVAVRGGYTYLDAIVSQSLASDETAVLRGVPVMNPSIPGVAIGGDSPLVGARPFQRPPQTGFFAVDYSRRKLTLGVKGAMAGRSDDSTFLGGLDTTANGNTLLLPNRDLDFGYLKLDLGGTYAWRRGFTFYGQIDNLLSDQRIGPIGYLGLPLTFRAGLKLRLGGN
jgi:vitamin B12 transporter